jgi:hypothetical protein
MELGDPTTSQGTERGRPDVALDAFEIALADLIETVGTGA